MYYLNWWLRQQAGEASWSFFWLYIDIKMVLVLHEKNKRATYCLGITILWTFI